MGVHPGGVTDENVQEVLADARSTWHGEFEALMSAVESYTALCTRLGLSPEQVDGYLRRERRLLAELYFAACEPRPSEDRLLRLAYQLALDARSPLQGSPEWFAATRFTDGSWAVGYHVSPVTRAVRLPPSRYVTSLSPLAGAVFERLGRTPTDYTGLAAVVRTLFLREPRPEDTAEPVVDPVVEYRVEDGQVRLWAAGVEVNGLHRKDEQALLRYFCRYPTARLTGPKLKEKVGEPGIANPSQAAKRVRAALRTTCEQAGDWFQTDPFRWAKGVRVIRKAGRLGGRDNNSR